MASSGIATSFIVLEKILISDLIISLSHPFTCRNNIIKHTQCMSLDAKLPIQECLSNKLRYFAKLLERGSGDLDRTQTDAIACAAMRLSDLKEPELKKLRKKFPHFKRFENALANAKVALPNDRMLIFQQG